MGRHGRRGSRFGLPAALLFACLAASSAARAQAMIAVDVVEVYALSRDPLPLTLVAQRSVNDIAIHATVRFANECLSRVGFDPIYRDLAPLRLTGTRLLLMRAGRAPEGCPDMYAPVERSFVLRMPDAADVRQIVLLDEIAGRHPAIVAVLQSSSPATDGTLARSAGALPLLSAATLSSSMDLRLRVALPDRCSPRDIAIEIVEGRSSAAAGQAATAIPLWVLVRTDSAACQAGVADRHVDAQVSLRSLILQNRQLWLVNTLLPSGGGAPRLFTRLEPG
jgi:hypothetical protein